MSASHHIPRLNLTNTNHRPMTQYQYQRQMNRTRGTIESPWPTQSPINQHEYQTQYIKQNIQTQYMVSPMSYGRAAPHSYESQPAGNPNPSHSSRMANNSPHTYSSMPYAQTQIQPHQRARVGRRPPGYDGNWSMAPPLSRSVNQNQFDSVDESIEPDSDIQQHNRVNISSYHQPHRKPQSNVGRFLLTRPTGASAAPIFPSIPLASGRPLSGRPFIDLSHDEYTLLKQPWNKRRQFAVKKPNITPDQRMKMKFESEKLYDEITQGRRIRVPKGHQLRVVDVVVIGAGAAGLQACETLSAGADSLSSVRPLTILHLEGRDRIGGRIDTRHSSRVGSEAELSVERGAAFIHSCDPDGTNSAFNLAVKYNLQRKPKTDFLDSWSRRGSILSSEGIHIVRECFSEIVEHGLMDEAAQLGIHMANRNSLKLDAREAHGLDDTNNQDETDGLLSIPQMDGAGEEPDDDDLDLDLLRSPPHSDDDTEDTLDLLRDPEEMETTTSETTQADQQHPRSQASAGHRARQVSSMRVSPPLAPAPAAASNLSPVSVSPSSSSEDSSANSLSSESESSSADSDVEITQRMKQQTPAKRRHKPNDSDDRLFKRERKKMKPERTEPHQPEIRKTSHFGFLVPSRATQPLKTQTPEPIEIDDDNVVYGDNVNDVRGEIRSPPSEQDEHGDDDTMHPESDLSFSMEIGSDDEVELSFKPMSAAEVHQLAVERTECNARRHRRETKQREKRQIQMEQQIERQRQQGKASNRDSVLPPGPQCHSVLKLDLKKLCRYRSRTILPKHATSAYYAPLDQSFESEWRKHYNQFMQHLRVQACGMESIEPTDIEDVGKILESLKISNFGYVAPTSHLSLFDISQAFGCTGGERYLPHGFDQIMHILQSRIQQRTARPKSSCRYELLCNHIVKIIDQPAIDSGSQTPFALVHCPGQKLVVLARYVIATPSIGLMHSSLKHEEHMRAMFGNRLQKSSPTDKSDDLVHPLMESAITEELATEPIEQAKIHYSEKDQKDCLSIEPEASILFNPSMSTTKREQFLARGMGLENKCILIFPRGSRFWPHNVHLLRSVTHPSWRFYNLDGIDSCDLSILIAHRPPTGDGDRWKMSAQQLESMTDEDILRELMSVLHELFTPNQSELTRRDIEFLRSRYPANPIIARLPQSKPHLLQPETKRQSLDGELTTCPGSDTIVQLDSSEDIHAAQHNQIRAELRRHKWDQADREETRGKKNDICDTSWQGKPVVPPLHMEVTRWGRDPFALGAYSFVPVGCDVHKVHSLLGWEPEEINTKEAQQDTTFNDASSSLSGVLLFAGEALSPLDSQQVHGAMESGGMAAQRVLQRMEQEQRARAAIAPDATSSTASSSSSI